MKQGLRKNKLQNDKKVKQGVKEFYNKLGQINELTNYLKTLDAEITEDNVDEIVTPLIGRELDSMEKFLVLGKMHNETQSLVITEDDKIEDKSK
ncbi:MAG TPA: hypothetical protein VF680_16920 [Allosphingosinicella sp.]|jgi:hypothetical protein